MSDAPAPAAPDRLAELRSSAKGWHGVQLSALGFIGLCGVLQTGDGSVPWGLQVISGILVLVSLALACLGIYLVGRAAWPLYGADPEPRHADDPDALALASVQLRSGLKATFASVAILALATASSWWPDEGGTSGGDGGQVAVQTSNGQSVCGRLAETPQSGALRVVTGTQSVVVALDSVASLSPVDGC